VLKTRDTIYVIEFKLGSAEEALAQLKARRYYEPYLADPRPIILLAAGGFEERAVQCLWEEVERVFQPVEARTGKAMPPY